MGKILEKKSKALKGAYGKISAETVYGLDEAIKLLVATKTVKFDATAEIHVNLGTDPRHADQQVRATVSLPHGTGKAVRVVVICSDDKVAAAKKAGAVEAGGSELIDKVAKGWTDFDVMVATPDMMKDLAKIARVLGPKGLMPSPKAGTVTPDVEKTVNELAAGRIEFRNDKAAIIHSVFGKVSFGETKLKENFTTLLNAIKNAKPAGAKGEYIKNLTINCTMGPGIKVDFNEA